MSAAIQFANDRRPVTFIARCNRCTKTAREAGNARAIVATRSTLWQEQRGGWFWFTSESAPDPITRTGQPVMCDITIPCRSCGQPRRADRMNGKHVAEIPCNAKCTSATGPNCDCSCGGSNHGAAHHV